MLASVAARSRLGAAAALACGAASCALILELLRLRRLLDRERRLDEAGRLRETIRSLRAEHEASYEIEIETHAAEVRNAVWSNLYPTSIKS